MGRKSLVTKSANESRQVDIKSDMLLENDKIVEPYLNYHALRALYGMNVYHKRSLRLKAMLLSQIQNTNINKYLPAGVTPKQFLFKFMLNAETYGSAFFEKAGTDSNFFLYPLSTVSARVDRSRQIYQKTENDYIPIEGGHFAYDTILSDYYGEPDYIAIIQQILSVHKADAYNAKFFDNGARPELAVIFEDSDPSDEQIDAITEFFGSNFRGYKNAHKNLILTTGAGDGQTKPKIRIEDLGKVEDLSFKELKEVGRDEIIAAHGVPPRLVGVVNPNALGGGGELVSQLEMFGKMTIEPKRTLVEEFFASHGIQLELAPFDATAFKDDADVVSGLVNAGIITPAEARTVIGWSGNGR
jgi:hypothetical protein